MFPDGTPTSFTEVAAFRRHAAGTDDFLRFDDFMPVTEHDGDVTHSLPAGSGFTVSAAGTANVAAPPLLDGVFEATFWATFPGNGNMSMVVRAGSSERGNAGAATAAPVLAPKDTCSQSAAEVYNGTDISGAGWKGIDHRTLDVSSEPDPASGCVVACCAWSGCAAWVVQSGTGPSQNDRNCTHATVSTPCRHFLCNFV